MAKACRATEHLLALRIVLSQPCDSTKLQMTVNQSQPYNRSDVRQNSFIWSGYDYAH
jgi:hypothetical protein